MDFKIPIMNSLVFAALILTVFVNAQLANQTNSTYVQQNGTHITVLPVNTTVSVNSTSTLQQTNSSDKVNASYNTTVNTANATSNHTNATHSLPVLPPPNITSSNITVSNVLISNDIVSNDIVSNSIVADVTASNATEPNATVSNVISVAPVNSIATNSTDVPAANSISNSTNSSKVNSTATNSTNVTVHVTPAVQVSNTAPIQVPYNQQNVSQFKFGALVLSSANLTVGQVQTLTASVSGGIPPYVYYFTVYNSTGNLAYQQVLTSYNTSQSYSFILQNNTGTGQFSADVSVTDTEIPPTRVDDPKYFNVCQKKNNGEDEGNGNPHVPTITPATSNILIGQTVTLVANDSKFKGDSQWFNTTGVTLNQETDIGSYAIKGGRDTLSLTVNGTVVGVHSYTFCIGRGNDNNENEDWNSRGSGNGNEQGNQDSGEWGDEGNDWSYNKNFCATAYVTVGQASSPVNVTISPKTATVTAGQSVIFTNTITGGTAPFSYSYTESNANGITQNGNNFTFANTGIYNITLIVKDSASHTGSSTATITVVPSNSVTFGSPQLKLQYTSIDVGQSEVIVANATGGTMPYTFAWTDNGHSVSGTSNQITFIGTVVGTNTIHVTVTDHNGKTASANAVITVNPALTVGGPQVTVPNSTIKVGQSETITANVIGGTTPYSFAWTANGNPIPGNTQSVTFTATVVGTNTIKVMVTDSAGQHVSGTGTVTVISSNGVAFGTPQLKLTYTSIDVGQSEVIVANVTGGTMPYTFAWTDNGHVLPGTSNQITFTGTVIGTNTIHVTVTDHNGKTASANAIITVNPALTVGGPQVTVPNSIISVGQSEVITANVIGGTTPYSFAWSANGNPIPGNTQSITFTATVVGANTIKVIVTDSAGQHVNGTGTVTVTPANGVTFGSPQLKLTYTSIDVGQSEVIVANVTGGTMPYSFAWTDNGHAISGTSNQITFTGTVVGTNTIHVTVTDHNGKTASANAVITVNPAFSIGAPQVIVSNTVLDAGMSEIITANVVGGTSPYAYAWTVNGNAIGQNGQSITFYGNTSTIGTDHIGVHVTDSAGQSVNGNAIVIVNPQLQLVNLAVSSSVIYVGENETVTATVSGGTSPYAYYFYIFNATNVLVTSAVHTNVVPASNSFAFQIQPQWGTGNYSVDSNVIDALGQQVVDPVKFKVFPALAVNLTPASGNVDIGQVISFNANVVGGSSPYTYSWTFNNGTSNSICSNSPSCTYTVTGSGTVNVMVTDSKPGTVNAATVLAVTGNVFSVSAAPSSSSISTGGQQAFTASSSGGTGPVSYQWYNDTSGTAAKISGATSNTLTIIAQSPGTFIYYVLGMDTGTTGPNTVQSANVMLTATAPSGGGGGGNPGGGGSSGGGGGSSGGGGGGGAFIPPEFVAVGNQCYQVNNFTQLAQATVTIQNRTFIVVENFISPTDAGVSINNVPYTLHLNETALFDHKGYYNYSVELAGISYIPIQQTITLVLCANGQAPVLNKPNETNTSGSPTLPAVNVTIPKIITANASSGTLNVTVTVTGGSGFFTYQWYNITGGDARLIPFATYPTLYLRPGSDAGNYTYYVIVDDTKTHLGTRSGFVTVNIHGLKTPPEVKPAAQVSAGFGWWPWILLLLLLVIIAFVISKRRKKQEPIGMDLDTI